jgi:hypothetical protein
MELGGIRAEEVFALKTGSDSNSAFNLESVYVS